jgi:hypothetical protein
MTLRHIQLAMIVVLLTRLFDRFYKPNFFKYNSVPLFSPAIFLIESLIVKASHFETNNV